jgi:uncharacterized protein
MWLKAHWCIPHVEALPLAQLEAYGIRGLVFDLDNTLIGPSSKQVTPAVLAVLHKLRRQGYRLCVLTNNKNQRYLRQAERQLGLPVIGPAYKPGTRGLNIALQWLQLPASQVVLVGDRPLTDTWAANRAHCPHVLVEPLEKATEHGLKRFLRRLEHLPVRCLNG